MTQKQLGQAVGFKGHLDNEIREFEQGIRAPTIDILNRIVEVLALTPQQEGNLRGLYGYRARTDTDWLSVDPLAHELKFAQFMEQETAYWLAPFSKGTIAIDTNLSLQLPSDFREGWKLSDVVIQYEDSYVPFPRTLLELYQRYYEANKESEGFINRDGDKIMLRKNPVSFTDAPRLILDAQKTKYSCCRFFHTNIAPLHQERNLRIRECLAGQITFHHSLAMIAVVVTSDDLVLLIHRSPKVQWANMWSPSLDEQLSDTDLQEPIENRVCKWAQRLLFEELGVVPTEYDNDNLRVLSVFLEGDVLNISLAAEFQLNLTSEQLNARIRVRARQDEEFDDWTFVSYDELLNQLFRSSHDCIATYRYSILLTLLRKFGVSELAKRLFGGNR
jgi:hypothetical protein